MLLARILTAFVMLLVFIRALFLLSRFDFALFLAIIIALAFWEWGGFLGFAKHKRITLGVAGGLVCLAFAYFFPQCLEARSSRYLLALYAANAAFWIFGATFWLNKKWCLERAPAAIGIVLGFLILFPLWLAIVQMQGFSVVLLVAAMAIVWIADSIAYFAGRAFGKNKLAPNISPGKTKEGALCGILGVVVYFVAITNSWQSAGGFCLAVIFGIFFAVLSIVGDLLESLFKRQAGIKDSSQLLPGHGGFLDRLDSLCAVLPIFWLCFQFSTVNA